MVAGDYCRLTPSSTLMFLLYFDIFPLVHGSWRLLQAQILQYSIVSMKFPAVRSSSHMLPLYSQRQQAYCLVQVPQGNRTEACLRNNISVGVQYLEAWLGGMGCVPLYNLMEDAATAEIGRTQVWQWLHHKATLDNKDVLTVSRFYQVTA